MNWVEIILVTGINSLILSGLARRQRNIFEKRIKLLRQEVVDLEDLVAAIIAEFKEVAQITPVQANLNDDFFETKIDLKKSIQVPPIQGSSDVSVDAEGSSKINNPKRQNILALSQRGLAVEEIAKQIGTGLGEVKLVLGIYGKN